MVMVPDTSKRLRICVIGATGRMGTSIMRDAPMNRFEVTGAVAAPGDPRIGKSLRDLGLRDSDTKLAPPSRLPELLRGSDVCISFTNAEAEKNNVQYIFSGGIPFVMGTTGFLAGERNDLIGSLRGRIPTVVASNFSVGANLLIALSASLKSLPSGFDISILEAHHSGKTDAPSGTALSIAEVVSKARGYTQRVHGRTGMSKREAGDLEIGSFRGGGMPGDHIVYAFGPNEMIKLEHLAFSRAAFALGSLHAAEWVAQGREPKIYSMMDVLGLTVPA